ncbi:endo alpha-1,4 polygalactosaminidase [Acidihalobacter ferrooxydans]|uniref:endo alpha-1,4 polygalactosaminidase n=1 Tax=Acidihalobacter ferrooxydans TaxID=1765967 RepID=UPI0012EB7767|nr:endo alpha-1,4 polygalactosaminidase [Acidihalobacter ferrooxydans]
MKITVLGLATSMAAHAHAAATTDAAPAKILPSVALYYGNHPDMNRLQRFDWVVLQPQTVQAQQLERPDTKLFTYISLGEVDKGTAAYKTLPSQCRIGQNKAWGSVIVDQSDPLCRRFYLHRIVDPLLKKGYLNFFFDTLDSYELVYPAHEAQQRSDYRRGLIRLIRAIHRRDPNGAFILNRGWNMMRALKNDGVVAVAAESLYRGWNENTKNYVRVSHADNRYLLKMFRRTLNAGLVPISISYLPRTGPHAERLARRIGRHDVVPYVTNAMLTAYGVGGVVTVGAP